MPSKALSPTYSRESSRTQTDVREEPTPSATVKPGTLFHENLVQTERALAELEAIRQFVPLIIADGPLQSADDRVWEMVVHHLASRDPRYIADVAKHEAAVDQLSALLSGDAWSLINDATDPHGFTFTERRIAYLIGLAVGQRLGPEAFKGGQR